MKKIIALVMALCLVMSMAACGASSTSSAAESAAASAASEATSAVASAAAAGDTNGDGEITIGATFYGLAAEFCTRMDNAGKKWAEENGVNYVSYDGNYDASTQLEQVETMIQNGVDAIVLNPQDADACVACVEKANEAGIPIVGVNTMVNCDTQDSYVGSDDVSAGEAIMQYMIDYLGTDTFNIVIIEGPMGQSAQLQRYEGITNVLKDYPNITILDCNTANWSRSEAMTLMETWITTYGDQIDAIIGENDEMALGALEAVEAAGMTIPAIGIDGITDAVTAVSEGKMIASDFQNAEGQMTGALDACMSLIKGESVEKEIWIPFEMITPDNYTEYVDRY